MDFKKLVEICRSYNYSKLNKRNYEKYTVSYNGVEYYPKNIICNYDKKGDNYYSVTLICKNANSCVIARLDKIKEMQ